MYKGPLKVEAPMIGEDEKSRRAALRESLARGIGKDILIVCDKYCYRGTIKKVGTDFVTLRDARGKAVWEAVTEMPVLIAEKDGSVTIAISSIKEMA